MNPSSPRCLIVEDQIDSLTLLLAFLEGQDLDLMVALDGEDGFKKAVAEQPDLILLDVIMPGIDGFTVCERLKADLRTQRIPVIFLSGLTAVEDKLRGFAVGACDYITKPFSSEEVLARVTVHMHIQQKLNSLEIAAGRRVLQKADVKVSSDEVIFAKAVELLEQQMGHPPGLVEMARKLGTNERKLTDIFRRRTGMTVFDFLAEIRLETGRRFLEGSSLQIQVIAGQVGYQNATDFTRAFRRRFQVTPREYRTAHAPAPGTPPDLQISMEPDGYQY